MFWSVSWVVVPLIRGDKGRAPVHNFPLSLCSLQMIIMCLLCFVLNKIILAYWVYTIDLLGSCVTLIDDLVECIICRRTRLVESVRLFFLIIYGIKFGDIVDTNIFHLSLLWRIFGNATDCLTRKFELQREPEKHLLVRGRLSN